MLQSFDRLRVFYYVYSCRSVVGASEILHVTQSAVSQSLQKLEDELRFPLFTRMHKKIIPTSAAEKLFKTVEVFMTDLDVCLKELEQARDYPYGELRIGAPPEFGKAYLSKVISDFRNEYQEVTFALKFGGPEDLLPLLKEGEIDYILLDEFITNVSFIGGPGLFHFEPVAGEEVIMVCSKEYFEETMGGHMSLDVLSRQSFICYKEDMQITRQWFKHHYGGKYPKIQRTLTVDNHEAIVSAVLYHQGLGVVSSHQVKKHLRRGRMVKITSDKKEIVNNISLVQLMDKVPTLTEKVFSRFLINSIQSMVSGKNHKLL